MTGAYSPATADDNMLTLLKFSRWVVEKTAAIALIVALGLAATGLWLFLRDNVDFDQWRADTVRALTGERGRFAAALEDVHKKMDRIAAEITAEQEKGKATDKVIAQLRELESTWDRLVGNREQQKSNAEQRAKMSRLRADVTTRVAALQQEFTRTTWERDGLEVALGKVDVRLREADANRSKLMHYLERAWWRARWWVGVTVALYFLGPTAGKVILFFWVAPLIARGRPVRLAGGEGVEPEVSANGSAAEVALEPAERLFVKERFLQASDEGLGKKTRFLLDWRMPFTCLGSGLVELVEMTNSRADGVQKVTLSNSADAHSELAIITLREGASLVLRPSFLAAVTVGVGRRLAVRRHWQFFRWQAWITLQFRFLEFQGPGRLIVAASRGVRVERLEGNARRTNQDATMGFTPGLEYRPTRAETWWGYWRGMNPLFDDRFAGRGLFLCQQVAAPGEAAAGRKIWSSVWGGVTRVFGL